MNRSCFVFAPLALSLCPPLAARDGFLERSFMYRGWLEFDHFVGGQRALAQSFRDATFDAQGRVIAVGGFQHPGGSANSDCVGNLLPAPLSDALFSAGFE